MHASLAGLPHPFAGAGCAGAPIGERLYSIKAEWDEKAARLRSTQEERAAAAAASTYVNARSEVGAGSGEWGPRPSSRPSPSQQPASRGRASHSRLACTLPPRPPHTQRMVERLKRDRFTAVFDYLRRGAPAPTLNLLEAVQVRGQRPGRHARLACSRVSASACRGLGHAN